jgi:hypothetical protein
MSFVLSELVNSTRVFLTRKSEATERWDPFYFRPELVALEKRVRKVTSHRLHDFVMHMAGGATPSTTADIHYTESADGVPFIRVQNLSTTGRLNLDDCKRITRSTHEGLLGRSKLSGGELLVKITGVGRMAVASVVPNDFEGNINQHIVAVRTKDAKTSETLAAYLNLDIAEKLASRRSTGGTRPALDYPALLSIPVIFDERLPKLVNTAVSKYEDQRAKAKALLGQIDDVLFDELGIKKQPMPPSTIENRMFLSSFRQVTGGRWDAHYHDPRYEAVKRQLKAMRAQSLRSLATDVFSGITPLSGGNAYVEGPSGVPFIRSGDFTADGSIDELALIHIRPDIHNGLMRRSRLKSHDVLFAIVGATIGKVGIFRGGYEANINQAVCAVRFADRSLAEFVHVFFLGFHGQQQLAQQKRPVARANLNLAEIASMQVPVLEPDHRARVVARVKGVQTKARELYERAEIELEQAKHRIEALILGKEAD